MISKYLALPAALALTACGGATTLPILYATDDSDFTDVIVSQDVSFGVTAAETRVAGSETDTTYSQGRKTIILSYTAPEGEDPPSLTLTFDGKTFTQSEIDNLVFVNGLESITFIEGGGTGPVGFYVLGYDQGDACTTCAAALLYAPLGLQTLPENMPSNIDAYYQGGGEAALSSLGVDPDPLVGANLEFEFNMATDFETFEAEAAFYDEIEYLLGVKFSGDVTGSNFAGTVSDWEGDLPDAAPTGDIEGQFAGFDPDFVLGTILLQFTIEGNPVGLSGAFLGEPDL